MKNLIVIFAILFILVSGCSQPVPEVPDTSEKDGALAALDSARDEIFNAETKGNNVTEAVTRMNEAQLAFNAGNYTTATSLAGAAKYLALNSKPLVTKQNETPDIVPPDVISDKINWSEDIKLSSDIAVHKSFNNANSILVDQNGVIHTVWYSINDGKDEIHYRRSTDGVTWGEDTILSTGPNFVGEVSITTDRGHEFQSGSNSAANPALAISGSNVYVAWRSDLNSVQDNTNGEIYFKKSTDSGVNWGPEVRLTNAPEDSFSPSISASGNILYVVWMDMRDGYGDLYFKYSPNAGTIWSSDLRLTEATSFRGQPTIIGSGNDVHAFWMDNREANWEIFFDHSKNGGAIWDGASRFTNDMGTSEVPVVARVGNTIYVAWTDSRPIGNENYADAYEIYLRKSTDGGKTWSNEIPLTNSPKWSGDPSIAAVGTQVHVVWPDGRDGSKSNSEIYHKYSLDGGSSWSDDIRITYADKDSVIPSIAVLGSNVYVLWEDTRGGKSEIFYKHGVFNG
ncbi:BNR repeat-like domain protein [Candidatus Bilamarchaeum dharawalense]|uniref:BNR repeat-like domain protein n=1 Tax=Candidatus Bilamarchaeum dharawalense TaxID=2885759 RepID=A0A5E4LXJ9_9ARCH|nr:BNR repeat-like domain protein [Candidatus Bilamarchaeum dharawalense]